MTIASTMIGNDLNDDDTDVVTDYNNNFDDDAPADSILFSLLALRL